MTAKVFMIMARGRVAHEYDLLTPDLRPRATCGKRSTVWIQELLPAANVGMAPERPYGMSDPDYCPKCLSN